MQADITNKPVPSEPDLIQCEVCLRDIPGSVAVTVEGSDYVHHYCGLDCLARWRACAEKRPQRPV